MKKYKSKFCARSGNVTAGNADLFSFSGWVVTPKIDSSNMKLVIADYLGNETTITSASSFSMSGKANGTHYVYIKTDGTLYTLANNLYRQAARPTLVDGDVWLNTSVTPFKCIKYTSAVDVEFTDVPLAKIVIANSAISSLETLPYNQNGFDVNMEMFTQNFAQPGWTKLPNGFILQWGKTPIVTSSLVLTFPIAFPTAAVSFVTTQYLNSVNTGGYGSETGVSTNSLSTTGVTLSSYSSVNGIYWIALGY